LLGYITQGKDIEESILQASAFGALAVSTPGSPANYIWTLDDIEQLKVDKVWVGC